MNKLLISGPVIKKYEDGVVLHTQNLNNSINEFFVPWSAIGEKGKEEMRGAVVSIVDLEATVSTSNDGNFSLHVDRCSVVNYKHEAQAQIILPEALN